MALALRQGLRTSLALSRSLSLTTQKKFLCASQDRFCNQATLDTRNDLLSNNIYQTFTMSNRFYAKAKAKGKVKSSKAGGKHSVEVADEEINEIFDAIEYRLELDKVIEEFKLELHQNMSVRTNYASFDRMLIKTEDGDIPLNQIATITQKGSSLVIIDLARSNQYVGDVLKTLQNSSMNLNPQQEKTHTIYVHIPKVSREHREGMAAGAKKMFNTNKEQLSKVYSKYLKHVNTYSKKGDKTLAENVKTKILEEMKERVDQAESMMKAKQSEILT